MACELMAVVESIKNQQIPDNCSVKIIVVDDGSSQDIKEHLEKIVGIDRLVHHEKNLGRSLARNTGLNVGKGDIVIYIDADCIPLGTKFIESHCHTLKNFDISCGNVVCQKQSNNFWDKYQNLTAKRREKEFKNKGVLSFTTANVAFKRDVLVQIGGFDSTYKYYGFEDRDLLYRCVKSGFKINFSSEAKVDHRDFLTIKAVCHKMLVAGQYTSTTFRKRYPNEYKLMPYAKIDTRNRKYLTFIPYFFYSIFQYMLPAITHIIHLSWIPFFLKKIIVKIYSAIYFMEGTRLSKLNNI